MKVAVIGYSGSGKSTLAKKLGRIYQCPVLHLDRINFEPGWRERDPEDARRTVSGFLDENGENGWIIDGNYSGLCQERRLKVHGFSQKDLSVAGHAPLCNVPGQGEGFHCGRM